MKSSDSKVIVCIPVYNEERVIVKLINELKTELIKETLIVNYVESGRRNRGLGYTIEVTIQFISAKSNTPICSCTAEGQ